MLNILQFISNHIMLSLLWMALLVAVIFLTIKKFFTNISSIVCSEVIRLVNDEQAIIIDVRKKDIYRKGHIINSINLSIADIKSSNLGQLAQKNRKYIIFVCENGAIARNLTKKLTKKGFEQIYFLEEGISGWSRSHLPLIQDKQ